MFIHVLSREFLSEQTAAFLKLPRDSIQSLVDLMGRQLFLTFNEMISI